MADGPMILNEVTSLAVFGALRARQHLHRIGSAMRFLSSQMSEKKGPTEEEHALFCEIMFWLAGVVEREVEEADNALEKWDQQQDTADEGAA